jgi:hypothetical protein
MRCWWGGVGFRVVRNTWCDPRPSIWRRGGAAYGRLEGEMRLPIEGTARVPYTSLSRDGSQSCACTILLAASTFNGS